MRLLIVHIPLNRQPSASLRQPQATRRPRREHLAHKRQPLGARIRNPLPLSAYSNAARLGRLGPQSRMSWRPRTKQKATDRLRGRRAHRCDVRVAGSLVEAHIRDVETLVEWTLLAHQLRHGIGATRRHDGGQFTGSTAVFVRLLADRRRC